MSVGELTAPLISLPMHPTHNDMFLKYVMSAPCTEIKKLIQSKAYLLCILQIFGMDAPGRTPAVPPLLVGSVRKSRHDELMVGDGWTVL